MNIPEYKIKFKNESLLMKILGKILFFNPDFMNNYYTTLGTTIYAPNKDVFIANGVGTHTTIAHEIVHIKDSQKYSRFIFGLCYLLPQALSIPAIGLFAILSWWMALPIVLFFLLPLPAFFRMKFEKKAYTISLYTNYLLSSKYGHSIDFDARINAYVSSFTTSQYYYMWLWFDKKYFLDTLDLFKNGQKPYYELEYYDMADQIIENYQKYLI